MPRSGVPGRAPARYRLRRRLAAAVLGVAALAGLALGARALVHDAGLADVEDVVVTGATTVPVPDVLAAAAVPSGVALAGVDTAQVAARVAALPAVAAVQVRRDWPHTLVVAITERVPAAVTQTAHGLFLVDGSGVVYRQTSDDTELPRLAFRGVGPDDPATLAALAVLAALPDGIRAQVRTVDVTPGAGPQVSVGLTEGRLVRWGSPDRAADKAAVLGPLLTRSGRVYDVASPGLATVRR